MDSLRPLSRVLGFGVYELDLHAGELRKHGIKLKLQQKPLALLAVLLEQAGEVVSREELRQRLWPEDTFGDFDHSMSIAVHKVRLALHDTADNPRFIETLSGRGYRFIAPVRRPTDAAGGGRGVKTMIAVLPFASLDPDPKNEY
ncbi:MAG: winged helix-turn-helix domain-containing protein, partial [Terriglobales bacterium]